MRRSDGLTELIAGAVEIFCAAGLDSPEADAREPAEVVGEGRLRGLLGSGAVPTPEQRAYFESMVAERATRVPLQHVTGVMYFRYLELVSRPGCLSCAQRPNSWRRRPSPLCTPWCPSLTQATLGTASCLQSTTTSCHRRILSHLWVLAVDLWLWQWCDRPRPGHRGAGSPSHWCRTLGNRPRRGAREQRKNMPLVVDLVHGDARTELSNFVGQVDVVVTNPPVRSTHP